MPKKALFNADITGQDKRVVEFLSKQKRVKLAYLFGSVAEGKEGKLGRYREKCGILNAKAIL